MTEMEKQTTKIRRLLLGAALVATLLAVVWVEENDGDMEEAVQPILPARQASNSAREKKSDIGHLQIGQLGKRKFNGEADDIFAATSWEPKRSPIINPQLALAPRQNAESAPPPAPVAPPLQFKYVGKVTEGNITSAFISMADESNYIAKVGERVDANYRVDRIDDNAIEFTYLPLGIKQTLLINNDNHGSF